MNLKYKVTNNKYFNIKEILKSYFQISDRLLVKLKKNKKIFLNNLTTYINKTVVIGDEISVNLDFEEESKNIIAKYMPLDILFEDSSFLIINKPAGLPIHPSILHFEDTISNGVKYYFNSINLKTKIRPVMRLDKDTSGIVIFAKNEYIQEALIKQMKNKSFKKEYYAILEGHLETKNGIINAPISRKENSIIEREINSKGDIAITNFELINNYTFSNSLIKNKKLSFVKFYLETGRTHQIRVHSKYINHPILGDSLYGNKSELISRQALHAYKISFIHPISKKQIVIEIDLPDDMKKVIL